MIQRMLEDLDIGEGDLPPREGRRTPLMKEMEQEKMVQSHQDKRTRRSVLELWENRSSIEGLLGKEATATELRTIEFSRKGKRSERQVRQRWRKERQVQRCWSTCLESANWKSSCELGGVVCTADKQAQRLARLTRLNAQRWICVQPRWHSRRS